MLLLIFRVGDDGYAVAADRVVEVVPRVGLRALPHASGALAGLFRYRGKVIPVLDLGLLLGPSACTPRLSTRIIVVDRGEGAGGWLGLVAEHVIDVRRVGDDELAEPPLRPGSAPYLGPIVQDEAGIIQLIEVGRIAEGS